MNFLSAISVYPEIQDGAPVFSGTRVRIEKKEQGGKVTIDFFSPEDLAHLCMMLAREEQKIQAVPPIGMQTETASAPKIAEHPSAEPAPGAQPEDIYSVRNFTV